jgi:hypothetical protein
VAKSITETNVDFIDGDDDWTTVADESGEKLFFTTPGEQFVGIYVGTDVITNPKPRDGDSPTFEQQKFRTPDGKLHTINGGHKIQQGMKDVIPGETVRLTYMGDIDTGSPSPMKDFRVDVKGRAAAPQESEESPIL